MPRVLSYLAAGLRFQAREDQLQNLCHYPSTHFEPLLGVRQT